MEEKQFEQFRSEWITIKQHRILLSCRISYPDDMMRFIAQIAVETCDNNSEDKDARVVKIYLDDKADYWDISIGSTKEADKQIEGRLSRIFGDMYDFGNIGTQVHIIDEGNRNSDRYNHTEYLSHKLFFDKKIF